MDQQLIEMAEQNTQALRDAVEGMSYNSLADLEQGTAVLYSITGAAATSDVAAKTLDSSGRQAATELISVGARPKLWEVL